MDNTDNVAERLDANLTQFRKDTGIWPPGRSMPAAMCGGRHQAESIQYDAWLYWQKMQTELAALKAENEGLTNVVCELRALFCEDCKACRSPQDPPPDCMIEAIVKEIITLAPPEGE